ncbi:ATP-binding cassette domain-containing protein [Microvirga tunisiensis]|uniref:ATP-binding cassette domain-containing protein n=2 Tax=Pannonibacter tanglangensis TaxID=2750084 RepID=A0ABW9ZLC9_9HYPH|nr:MULTISPECIES: ATP-binding cassette domain-containing protein [unclassified Pannonibacter]NBN65101.1 ATP-binding cassette domain-containing protein [Pannonibacter sp. XCT-34]NBN79923.1 ATP-binding cassette domain-containing protein [Pannonibacter sp. XCT-53]
MYLSQTGGPSAALAVPPLVLFEGVTKRFPAAGGAGEVAALDGISLNVPKGQVTAIIGRSGAGKSTLIRLANGLEKPTSGRVVVDGIDVAGLSEGELRGIRREVGMVFQHFNLLASRTVFDNVALPLEIAGADRVAIGTRVSELLDLVGLADKRNRYPSELSGGQKQRVGIARALATGPKLLLSDEATSALDPETTRSVLTLLKQINRDLGLTILLITHEMDVVKQIADDVAVIDRGRIVEQGSAFDVLATPRHATTRSLLAGLPGHRLPDAFSQRLSAAPVDGGRAVLRVVSAAGTGSGLLADLVAPLGGAAEIIAGTVETVGPRSFAAFVVTLPPYQAEQITAASPLPAGLLSAEVLGYVA